MGRASIVVAIMLVITSARSVAADGVIYSPRDSAEVEKWLSEANTDMPVNELTLFFANKMTGRPYVAFTLEQGDDEQLVVNLQELDCTTFVETSAALAITAETGGKTFADFCDVLRRLRYRDGIVGDYSSRIHYFSEWITNNEDCRYVTDKGKNGKYPFIARQTIDATFMSSNPQYYKRLKNDTAMVAKIKTMETTLCGKIVNYIPKSLLDNDKRNLRSIQDGDIIALITSKKGLEISHVGIAVWQQGKLHLLNASSLQHKVILDTQTLYNYQKARPSQLGIRVIGLQ